MSKFEFSNTKLTRSVVAGLSAVAMGGETLLPSEASARPSQREEMIVESDPVVRHIQPRLNGIAAEMKLMLANDVSGVYPTEAPVGNGVQHGVVTTLPESKFNKKGKGYRHLAIFFDDRNRLDSIAIVQADKSRQFHVGSDHQHFTLLIVHHEAKGYFLLDTYDKPEGGFYEVRYDRRFGMNIKTEMDKPSVEIPDPTIEKQINLFIKKAKNELKIARGQKYLSKGPPS